MVYFCGEFLLRFFCLIIAVDTLSLGNMLVLYLERNFLFSLDSLIVAIGNHGVGVKRSVVGLFVDVALLSVLLDLTQGVVERNGLLEFFEFTNISRSNWLIQRGIDTLVKVLVHFYLFIYFFLFFFFLQVQVSVKTVNFLKNINYIRKNFEFYYNRYLAQSDIPIKLALRVVLCFVLFLIY